MNAHMQAVGADQPLNSPEELPEQCTCRGAGACSACLRFSNIIGAMQERTVQRTQAKRAARKASRKTTRK